MAHRLILFSLIPALLPTVLRAQVDSLSARDSLVAAPPAAQVSTGRIKVKFPWSVQSFNKDLISRLPFRGTENYLPLAAGVVSINNELHLRGSRSNEAGYFIDGVDVTNPMYGSNGVSLIPEALEVLEVHTGPYSAAMGSYNGGIVMSRMKTGGDQLSAFVDIQSDKFRSPGKEFLKTTVQGYENVVGTIGGPLPWLGIRFFLAGQRTTYANRQPMFLEPFRYENLVDDGLWRYSNVGRPLPGPVAFSRNFLPGNRSERSTFQGNGTIELYGISLSAMGSYDENEYTVGSEWPLVLTNYFNQSKNMISRTKTKLGAVRAEYSLGEIVSATVSFSFYDRYSKTFDPVFKDNWLAYGDSAANATYFNTSKWLNRYNGPDLYSTIFAFRFYAPGAPNNKYSKNRQSQTRWAIDLVSHPISFLEVKAGGSIDSWTMRSFNVGNVSNLLRFLDPDQNGVPDAVYASEYEKRIRYLERGGITNYGYTFLGRESDGYKLAGSPDALLDPPYEPIFTSAYAEGTIRSEGAYIQAGIRYERFDPKLKTATLAPNNYGFYNIINYNVALGIMDESKINPTDPVTLLLPRINLQFSPTDRTTFHAGYGLFAQMPALSPLYVSSHGFSRAISGGDRSPYGGELAFEVRPERSKLFEFGIEQVISPLVTTRATAFYKVLSNQIQMARYYDPQGTILFTQYRNDGNGRAKGIEVECNVTFSSGFSALLTYEYSMAEGLSSNPRSNRVLFSDETFPPVPTTMYPYDYQQSHRATALLHARTNENLGILLGGIEATAILSARGGHPYTKEYEIQNLGASSPWNIGVYSIQDPRFVYPLEAHNSSTTPISFNLDLRLSKSFDSEVAAVTVFLDILNVLNTKNILNVYPKTGTANDDSWLASSFSENNRLLPNYESFYRDINLENRWAYMGATGYDLYSPPRRIQFGVNVTLGSSQ